MARLRFPGRPGCRFDRLGVRYGADEARNVKDPSLLIVANIHRGLLLFRELCGASDEEEEFEGFTAQDIKESNRKLRKALAAEWKDQPQSPPSCEKKSVGTRISQKRESLDQLPTSDRTRSREKIVVAKSYKTLIKEGLAKPSKPFTVKHHASKAREETLSTLKRQKILKSKSAPEALSVGKLKKKDLKLKLDFVTGVKRGRGRPPLAESASKKSILSPGKVYKGLLVSASKISKKESKKSAIEKVPLKIGKKFENVKKKVKERDKGGLKKSVVCGSKIVKGSNRNLAKQLLQKAKKGQQTVKETITSSSKSPKSCQRKQFVLPTQSSRSSRVIIPNKRFLEDDSFHELVAKQKKAETKVPEQAASAGIKSPSHTAQGQNVSSPHFSDMVGIPTGMAPMVTFEGGLLEPKASLYDQPLIVEGKRERKPSLKVRMKLSDENVQEIGDRSFEKHSSEMLDPSMSETPSRTPESKRVHLTPSKLAGSVSASKLPTSPIFAPPKFGVGAYSSLAERKRLAALESEALATRRKGHNILRKAKLQLNRAALNRSKADLARTLKKEMRREEKLDQLRQKQMQAMGGFSKLPGYSTFGGVTKNYMDTMEDSSATSDIHDDENLVCAICGDKNIPKGARALYYGVPSCEACRRFYRNQLRRSKERTYRCKSDGNCVVSVRARPGCIVCKFAKCQALFPEEEKLIKLGRDKSPTKELSPQKKAHGKEEPPEEMEVDVQTSDSQTKPGELSPSKPVAEGSQTVTSSPESAVSASPTSEGRGPRIKHVCRKAAVVLGKPVAKFPQHPVQKSEITLSALPRGEKVKLWKKDEESKADLSDDERPMDEIIQQSEDHIITMKKSPTKTPVRFSKAALLRKAGRGGKRKLRCKECAGCLATECGKCVHCLDKPKFGGTNKIKQACIKRRCSNPHYSKAATDSFIKHKNSISTMSDQGDSPLKDCSSSNNTSQNLPSDGRSKDSQHGMGGGEGGKLPTNNASSDLIRQMVMNNKGNRGKQDSKAVLRENDSLTRTPATVSRQLLQDFVGPSESIGIGSVPRTIGGVAMETGKWSTVAMSNIPDYQDVRVKKAGLQMPRKLLKGKDKMYTGMRAEMCVLQPIGATLRQWTSVQPVGGHRVTADFKENYNLTEAWQRGVSLTMSGPLCVRTVCFLCGSAGKHDFMYCNVCCEPYHEFCLEEEERPNEENLENWCCKRCQFCNVCGHQNNLLRCDKCQNTYHPECLGPNYPTKPSKKKKIWICTKCVKCKSCGATTPGSAGHATWTYDFQLCYECGKLMDKGNFCPICHKCYSDDDWESKMVQCVKCDSWVHAKCEGLTDEMYERVSYLPEDVHYICKMCSPSDQARHWELVLKEDFLAGIRNVFYTILSAKCAQHLIYMQKKDENVSDVKAEDKEESECGEDHKLGQETCDGQQMSANDTLTETRQNPSDINITESSESQKSKVNFNDTDKSKHFTANMDDQNLSNKSNAEQSETVSHIVDSDQPVAMETESCDSVKKSCDIENSTIMCDKSVRDTKEQIAPSIDLGRDISGEGVKEILRRDETDNDGEGFSKCDNCSGKHDNEGIRGMSDMDVTCDTVNQKDEVDGTITRERIPQTLCDTNKHFADCDTLGGVVGKSPSCSENTDYTSCSAISADRSVGTCNEDKHSLSVQCQNSDSCTDSEGVGCATINQESGTSVDLDKTGKTQNSTYLEKCSVEKGESSVESLKHENCDNKRECLEGSESQHCDQESINRTTYDQSECNLKEDITAVSKGEMQRIDISKDSEDKMAETVEEEEKKSKLVTEPDVDMVSDKDSKNIVDESDVWNKQNAEKTPEKDKGRTGQRGVKQGKVGHVRFNDLSILSRAVPTREYPANFEEIRERITKFRYITVEEFSEDVAHIINEAINDPSEQRIVRKKQNQSVRSMFLKQMEKSFPWFNIKTCQLWEQNRNLPPPISQENDKAGRGMLPDAVLPPGEDHTYAQWLERQETPKSPQPSPFKKLKHTPIKRLAPIVALDDEGENILSSDLEDAGEDMRRCILCWHYGDADPNEAGRLLFAGQDDWIHVNCALWSAEVYEEEHDGSLQNVHSAVSRGKLMKCDKCNRSGATVGCCTRGCPANYHFMCARHSNCLFQDDKKVFCSQHCDKVDGELVNNQKFAVTRRVCVDKKNMKKTWSKGLDPAVINLLIGACTVESLGRLTPASDCRGCLLPVDYICSRVYWSTRDSRKRCVYTCRIVEVQPNSPKSAAVVIKDMTIVHDESHPDYRPLSEINIPGLNLFPEAKLSDDKDLVDLTDNDLDIQCTGYTAAICQSTKFDISMTNDELSASYGGSSTSAMMTSKVDSDSLSSSWPLVNKKKPDSKKSSNIDLTLLSPKTLKLLNIKNPEQYQNQKKPVQNCPPLPVVSESYGGPLTKIAERLNQAAAKSAKRSRDSRSLSCSPVPKRNVRSRSNSVDRMISPTPRSRSNSVEREKLVSPAMDQSRQALKSPDSNSDTPNLNMTSSSENETSGISVESVGDCSLETIAEGEESNENIQETVIVLPEDMGDLTEEQLIAIAEATLKQTQGMELRQQESSDMGHDQTQTELDAHDCEDVINISDDEEKLESKESTSNDCEAMDVDSPSDVGRETNNSPSTEDVQKFVDTMPKDLEIPDKVIPVTSSEENISSEYTESSANLPIVDSIFAESKEPLEEASSFSETKELPEVATVCMESKETSFTENKEQPEVVTSCTESKEPLEDLMKDSVIRLSPIHVLRALPEEVKKDDKKVKIPPPKKCVSKRPSTEKNKKENVGKVNNSPKTESSAFIAVDNLGKESNEFESSSDDIAETAKQPSTSSEVQEHVESQESSNITKTIDLNIITDTDKKEIRIDPDIVSGSDSMPSAFTPVSRNNYAIKTLSNLSATVHHGNTLNDALKLLASSLPTQDQVSGESQPFRTLSRSSSRDSNESNGRSTPDDDKNYEPLYDANKMMIGHKLMYSKTSKQSRQIRCFPKMTKRVHKQGNTKYIMCSPVFDVQDSTGSTTCHYEVVPKNLFEEKKIATDDTNSSNTVEGNQEQCRNLFEDFKVEGNNNNHIEKTTEEMDNDKSEATSTVDSPSVDRISTGTGSENLNDDVTSVSSDGISRILGITSPGCEEGENGCVPDVTQDVINSIVFGSKLLSPSTEDTVSETSLLNTDKFGEDSKNFKLLSPSTEDTVSEASLLNNDKVSEDTKQFKSSSPSTVSETSLMNSEKGTEEFNHFKLLSPSNVSENSLVNSEKIEIEAKELSSVDESKIQMKKETTVAGDMDIEEVEENGNELDDYDKNRLCERTGKFVVDEEDRQRYEEEKTAVLKGLGLERTPKTTEKKEVVEKSPLKKYPLRGRRRRLSSSPSTGDSIEKSPLDEKDGELPIHDLIARKIKAESLAKSSPGIKGPFKCKTCKRLYRTRESYKTHIKTCDFEVSTSDEEEEDDEKKGSPGKDSSDVRRRYSVRERTVEQRKAMEGEKRAREEEERTNSRSPVKKRGRPPKRGLDMSPKVLLDRISATDFSPLVKKSRRSLADYDSKSGFTYEGILKSNKKENARKSLLQVKNDGEAVEKRKRGRPCKTQSLPAVNVHNLHSNEVKEKRGRGRPPRSSLCQDEASGDSEENTPRKRGRPSKKTAGNVNENMSEEKNTPRKRGRPPRKLIAYTERKKSLGIHELRAKRKLDRSRRHSMFGTLNKKVNHNNPSEKRVTSLSPRRGRPPSLNPKNLDRDLKSKSHFRDRYKCSGPHGCGEEDASPNRTKNMSPISKKIVHSGSEMEDSEMTDNEKDNIDDDKTTEESSAKNSNMNCSNDKEETAQCESTASAEEKEGSSVDPIVIDDDDEDDVNIVEENKDNCVDSKTSEEKTNPTEENIDPSQNLTTTKDVACGSDICNEDITGSPTETDCTGNVNNCAATPVLNAENTDEADLPASEGSKCANIFDRMSDIISPEKLMTQKSLSAGNVAVSNNLSAGKTASRDSSTTTKHLQRILPKVQTMDSYNKTVAEQAALSSFVYAGESNEESSLNLTCDDSSRHANLRKELLKLPVKGSNMKVVTLKKPAAGSTKSSIATLIEEMKHKNFDKIPGLPSNILQLLADPNERDRAIGIIQAVAASKQQKKVDNTQNVRRLEAIRPVAKITLPQNIRTNEAIQQYITSHIASSDNISETISKMAQKSHASTCVVSSETTGVSNLQQMTMNQMNCLPTVQSVAAIAPQPPPQPPPPQTQLISSAIIQVPQQNNIVYNVQPQQQITQLSQAGFISAGSSTQQVISNMSTIQQLQNFQQLQQTGNLQQGLSPFGMAAPQQPAVMTLSQQNQSSSTIMMNPNTGVYNLHQPVLSNIPQQIAPNSIVNMGSDQVPLNSQNLLTGQPAVIAGSGNLVVTQQDQQFGMPIQPQLIQNQGSVIIPQSTLPSGNQIIGNVMPCSQMGQRLVDQQQVGSRAIQDNTYLQKSGFTLSSSSLMDSGAQNQSEEDAKSSNTLVRIFLDGKPVAVTTDASILSNHKELLSRLGPEKLQSGTYSISMSSQKVPPKKDPSPIPFQAANRENTIERLRTKLQPLKKAVLPKCDNRTLQSILQKGPAIKPSSSIYKNSIITTSATANMQPSAATSSIPPSFHSEKVSSCPSSGDAIKRAPLSIPFSRNSASDIFHRIIKRADGTSIIKKIAKPNILTRKKMSNAKRAVLSLDKNGFVREKGAMKKVKINSSITLSPSKRGLVKPLKVTKSPGGSLCIVPADKTNEPGVLKVTQVLKKPRPAIVKVKERKHKQRKTPLKSRNVAQPHVTGVMSHPIIHPQKDGMILPQPSMEEEVIDSPISSLDEPDGQNSGVNDARRKNLPHVVFEITSDDGFQCQADSMNEAWRQVTERVQDARVAARMKQLSFQNLNGVSLFGLNHEALIYLIEQLHGAHNCRSYKFKFHEYAVPDEEEPAENPTGSIRTEGYVCRKPFDMFSFLMSMYRKRPNEDAQDKRSDVEMVHKSSRRATSMDLPMAMRFRKLKEHSREAVGVYRSNIHGRGLYCKRNIDGAEMIIEYAGEVIRASLTDKREKYYESKGIGCYMFRIDDVDVVDATMHGSAARFINHSCDPNCYSKVIQVDNKKHIVIFAMRPIKKGEELTYDYKFPIEEVKIPCTCGSKRCRKYLN